MILQFAMGFNASTSDSKRRRLPLEIVWFTCGRGVLVATLLRWGACVFRHHFLLCVSRRARCFVDISPTGKTAAPAHKAEKGEDEEVMQIAHLSLALFAAS